MCICMWKLLHEGYVCVATGGRIMRYVFRDRFYGSFTISSLRVKIRGSISIVMKACEAL